MSAARAKARSARPQALPRSQAMPLRRLARQCGMVVAWALSFTLSASAAQYRYDVWTAENGLPQNIVRGIAQTPDGYLWVATMNGVARFDGARFTVFNKSNTPGIASNRFRSMIEDPDGDLWLDSESGSLTRYHRGSFRTYGAEDGIPANGVRGIAGDDAGNLWILSEESIAKWNKVTGELLDVTPENLHVHYEPLIWGARGFWGTDAASLHTFCAGRFASYALPAWLPASAVWKVGVDEDGSTWVESNEWRQWVIPPGGRSLEPASPAGLTQTRDSSFRDPHGQRWTIRMEARLKRLLEFSSSGETASVPMDSFLEDREGNMWVGSEGTVLFRLQEQSVQVYSKGQGLADSNIYPVLQDRSGAVWMGAWESGLARFSEGNITNYTLAQGMNGRLVTALAEDRDGNLWTGMYGALVIFKDGRFRKPSGIFLPEHSVVQALLQDRGGTIWIGTSNGLILYRDGPSKTLTIQDGLATNDVRTIVEDRMGEVWIGGYGGLTRIHDGQFTRWSEHEGLPSDNVRAVYEDADGVVWIGTYDGGLGRLKNGRLTRYTERDGLFDNGAFQILEDGRGNLWMSCNRGIYRVSKQELNSFADGLRSTITSVAYGKSDGMLNVECNGGMWPAGIRARDGKLWFPTQDGVAVIDPNTVRINPQPPPVVIEATLVDHSPAAFGGLLKIPPGKENVEIEYTALSFIHPEQIRFRYRLEGLDSDWVDAGARRTAYYSHLPPGSYTFHVIAANSDGVWNTRGQSLAITVRAPFYRTWWFTALEVLAVAALIWMAVRYRLAQLHQRQTLQQAFSQQLIASQENERQRIAAELHDSLGQRLVVINNLALMSMRAKVKSAGAVGEADAMGEISGEAALAIQETREISYNLRPFQLDRLGLTKAVEGIARTVASAAGIRIDAEVENIDDAFPEELRIHFYRIVQESLNNVMKHSHASEAQLRIARSQDGLTLSIRDNGMGFHSGSRVANVGKSGFGLTGMAERAHSLGGSFRIRSAPGHGTAMTVEIPLGGERHE